MGFYLRLFWPVLPLPFLLSAGTLRALGGAIRPWLASVPAPLLCSNLFATAPRGSSNTLTVTLLWTGHRPRHRAPGRVQLRLVLTKEVLDLIHRERVELNDLRLGPECG